MSANNILFEKDSNKKDNRRTSDVRCDIDPKRQTYRKTRVSKDNEELHHVKYTTGREGTPLEGCSPPRLNRNDGSYRPSKNSKSNTKRCEPNIIYNDDHDYSCQPKEYDLNKVRTLPPHCYELPHPRKQVPCVEKTQWQNAKYCRDDCGSGIIPTRFDFRLSRRIWCRTPLTTYQASHGELGRQILCREKIIQRKINEGPPCNICEYVLPPCRGYYRKYDCVNPCDLAGEESVYKDGRNRPRDKVERYWEACQGQKERIDINKFAPQNMALALKYKRKAHGVTCW